MSEILAPAGNKQSAIIAINSGADAIYLGLSDFSARSSAENFTAEGLKEICGYAHLFGVKVYVALNTVVKQKELESFFESVKTAVNSGADAIIIQDLFLGKFIKRNFPQASLHLSTQAGTCNVFGAQLAKEYGFDRVILARETKIEDIAEISRIIETEVFVQGALCTCFSGQCYMSSFVGGNSGNRGKCKQPCRKKYSLDRIGFEDPAYRLSLSDLCVGEDIFKLIDAGVSSFKIEGRMRRPEYVSAAVEYYKNLLGGKSASLSPLKRTYNRGNYTKGLAFSQDNLISSAVQGHIGEYVGTIKVENSKYVCYTKEKFSKGDGFKILRDGKEVGGASFQSEFFGGFCVSTKDRLKNGDKIFITTDVALNEKLLSKKRLLPVEISADFTVGEPAKIWVNGVKIVGDKILQSAQSRPLTVEDVKNNFDKVDKYPFKPVYKDLKVGNVFLLMSELNLLRRKVYDQFYSALTENKNGIIENKISFDETEIGSNDKVCVLATNLSGVQADIGILKLNSLSNYSVNLLKDFKGEKFLYVPPYISGKELESIKNIITDFDGIYCDSYFGAKLAEEAKVSFFAGFGFNISNSVSLAECKAKYVCISKELTLSEANAISTEKSFYLTGGNIKLMDLIYCPFEKKCFNCDKRSLYHLTDESGRKFPIRRYVLNECRFEVYNCADLCGANGNSGAFYDLTLLDACKTMQSINGGKPLEKIFSNYTRGHLQNGIF